KRDLGCVALTIQAEYGYGSDVSHVVELRLSGVRELSLPPIRGVHGFDGLAIEDISSWQHEGGRYWVHEAEEGGMSCSCQSVRFTRLLTAEDSAVANVLWQEET